MSGSCFKMLQVDTTQPNTCHTDPRVPEDTCQLARMRVSTHLGHHERLLLEDVEGGHHPAAKQPAGNGNAHGHHAGKDLGGADTCVTTC